MILNLRRPALHRAAGSLVLAAACLTTPLTGQEIRPDYVKRTERVRMRDGAQLYTEILTPANQSGPLPILMERTPYNATLIGPKLADRYKVLADEGYIFIAQDIRGKYKSDGTFMMIRPPRDPKRGEQVDEGTDTNDTIDWLLKNVPNNNGRVGMVGISYGGWLTMMALVEPHPALKAASPQASPDDMYLGDDFHHNGAFRLSYGFEYVASLEAGKISKPFEFDRLDTFEWFLRLGGLANADRKYFKGQRPSWTDFVDHPNFDEFWKRRKVSPVFAKNPVTVPTLTVGGWWDQEDFYGPITIYDAMEPNDSKRINYMVLGRGITAAGPGATVRAWDRFSSEATRRSGFASRRKGPGSPIGSRTSRNASRATAQQSHEQAVGPGIGLKDEWGESRGARTDPNLLDAREEEDGPDEIEGGDRRHEPPEGALGTARLAARARARWPTNIRGPRERAGSVLLGLVPSVECARNLVGALAERCG